MGWNSLHYMQVKSLNRTVEKRIKLYGLQVKFYKALALFKENPRHPSLHTELLEPKSWGVYSFRIDRKYRVLFYIKDKVVEITNITLHYQ